MLLGVAGLGAGLLGAARLARRTPTTADGQGAAAAQATAWREEGWLRRSVRALGTRVELLARHGDPTRTAKALREALGAIYRVHEGMTRFEPSPLTWFNRVGHDRPVALDAELFAVLAACQRIALASEGCFDPTVGSFTGAAARARDPEATAWPSEPRAGDGAPPPCGAGIELLQLQHHARQARLLHPALRLDLGGIAKGYAVDRAAAALRQAGLVDFLVNAGGDLYAAGDGPPAARGPDGRGWRISIAAPPGGTRPPRELSVRDQAVATSGDWWRPGHLRDPHTGAAAGGPGLRAATVVADSALEADAWATAAFVAGPARGPALVAGGAGRRLVLT